ncbi:unnamed protein product [Anisakis simplex]|uniref:AN1-type zinc finger protein 2B n=1 Tax=Anisakis simplex TaxID=6269 RepID=A0A0M3JVB4_ANISI|nr:unnamed protein product [Anisakis simplex]
MAEFPGLGRHCSFAECHLLDFLPVRCDACSKDFCATHYPYDSHRCDSSYKKDVQVPVCPLCGKPVPVARGELPDERVGQHIDADCKSDPALASKGRIYTNRCSMHGCKKRELIPIQCKECGMNFCVKHRFPADHDCELNRANIQASNGQSFSQAAKSAIARQMKQLQQKQRSFMGSMTAKPEQQQQAQALPTQSSSLNGFSNGSLSEDEALARALQASLNDIPSSETPQLTTEEIDAALAEQLQRNEYVYALKISQSAPSTTCKRWIVILE